MSYTPFYSTNRLFFLFSNRQIMHMSVISHQQPVAHGLFYPPSRLTRMIGLRICILHDVRSNVAESRDMCAQVSAQIQVELLSKSWQ
jgi:hypothetical protein